MATETELERIVVRLVGDTTSFVKSMTTAVTSTQAGVTRMITSLNRLEGFANTLLGTFGRLGVAASLKGAFDQFAKMELGQIRLNSIIEANGGNVAELTAKYRRVAEAISSVTLNTKGEVLALFQQAEAQQFSGDAAENVVRNSIALAGATGQSAESMMRVAAQIQRGHPEFAQRILGLRGIKDGTELVTAITRRMAGGMAVAQAEFNSASGRMERLGRSLKSVGTEVGGLIAGALLPLVDFVQRLTEQFKLLDESTKKVVYQVTGLTLAWLGMGPVISVLKGILSPITSLVYYLGITLPLTILNTAAWLAWKTAVLLTTVVLAVATSTIAGIPILIAAVTVAFLSWAAIVSGLTAIGSALYVAFAAIGNLSGPFAQIGEMMSGWLETLKSVVRVMKTDMPLAWDLLRAGFTLAISQLRDLWPPLWTYISQGFGNVFTFLGEEIPSILGNAAKRAELEVARSIGAISQRAYEGQLLLLNVTRAVQNGTNISRLNIANRGLTFQSPTASPETIAARNALQMLQTQANAVADAAETVSPVMEQAGHTMGSALTKGLHAELKKIDQVAFDSVEAFSRIADYVERFNNPQGTHSSPGSSVGGLTEGGGGGFVPAQAGGLPAGGNAGGQAVALLTRIANGIDRLANRAAAAPQTADFTGI